MPLDFGKKTVKEELRRILSTRERKTIADSGLTPSAVLLLLYEDQGEYHILFTKRTEGVEHHKGQISFPGGALEEGDESPLATALRETYEEIGVQVRAAEVLGELDNVRTISSSYVICPFVAVTPRPRQFRLNNEEIERVIAVPIAALLDNPRFREETVILQGQPYATYFYEYGGDVIWGATARILKQFLDLIS